MKISIFTPDHRGAKALQPTYESVRTACDHLLLHKPEVEVEWLVGWNGAAGITPYARSQLDTMPKCHVREVSLPDKLDGSVGALKQALCEVATGDYLLELDSDDWLTEDALVELADYITGFDYPDFLYSDAIRLKDGGEYLFGGNCGWEVESHTGHRYNPTPKMTAANLYTILHAPDHFRCWRREFYNHIGGHNPDFKICDDFDLLQRTYLATGKTVHIEKPLYIYNVRGDGSNTWLQNVKEIQRTSRQLGDERLTQLLQQEANLTGRKVLEIGGKKGTPGRYTVAFSGADLNCDLRHGIPLEENSCVAVYAQDTLEHFETCSGVNCTHRKGSCVVGIMQEIHRVLIPGGMLIANTPSTNGDGAWGDPSHKSGWNMWSVNYYTEKAQANFLGQETGEPRCKFIRHRAYEWYPSQWHRDNNLKYLHFTLGALKPGVYGASSLR